MIKLKYRKNQKMSWQYALANNIFFDEEDNDMFSSKKMNGNFYELKRKKLPMYLYNSILQLLKIFLTYKIDFCG